MVQQPQKSSLKLEKEVPQIIVDAGTALSTSKCRTNGWTLV